PGARRSPGGGQAGLDRALEPVVAQVAGRLVGLGVRVEGVGEAERAKARVEVELPLESAHGRQSRGGGFRLRLRRLLGRGRVLLGRRRGADQRQRGGEHENGLSVEYPHMNLRAPTARRHQARSNIAAPARNGPAARYRRSRAPARAAWPWAGSQDRHGRSASPLTIGPKPKRAPPWDQGPSDGNDSGE